jgi:hypothetical protein
VNRSATAILVGLQAGAVMDSGPIQRPKACWTLFY